MNLVDEANNYFKKNDFLTKRDQKKLLELTQLATYQKNEIVLPFGGKIKQVGLVLKGLIRVYDKNNKTVWVIKENGVYGSIKILTHDKPSSHCYETLEETSMFLLNHDEIEDCIPKYPNIGNLLLMYWKNTSIDLYKHYNSNREYTPQERYVRILEKSPDLIQRMKSKDLASFIGIHPVSLSRLKNNYFTKNSIK